MRSRSLGFTSGGADGSQGTVLDVNVTAGTKCVRAEGFWCSAFPVTGVPNLLIVLYYSVVWSPFT